ncbi:MAG TPA: beta-ketoacyl-[acyl-carrier-protein] synthase family protein [Usitatibacter sp.]|jgi:3-oxoacyl-[acyl-carrier-protein] synthase-1|nr:beta-ketoacyl-[acyl-carrier-protein] synthase family protein [Usitatibacter sp.]
MRPILVSSFTTATCLGRGAGPLRRALASGTSGLEPCRFETCDLDTWIGMIPGLEEQRLPARLAAFDCRNNRAAEAAIAEDGFEDAVRRVAGRRGASRVGVFLGTSTSGILEAELAYRRREGGDGALPADFDYRRTHNAFSLVDYVRARLGLRGPAAALSTACSSSAKAFASAARYVEAGMIDAAVVGGVDSLCLTTLYGFNSLQLLSPRPCRPYDARRDGISIGEAAALILLERCDEPRDGASWLLGAGESCDAYHMSSPHPEGAGARLAMEAALRSAGVAASAIDYVNLHGTGTPSNDAAEDKAIEAVFGRDVPCSSTKGMTGHTLGAAGGVEAIVCLIAMADGLVPGSPGTREVDSGLRAHYELTPRARRVDRTLSNSFGFGGTNCSLVFGRAAA